MAFGPVINYPTATEDELGYKKWCAGPSAAIFRQDNGFTYGVYGYHLWSFAGDSDRDNVSLSFIQPVLAYSLKTHTTFMINTEATYDWKTNQWTVPINFAITQLLRVKGKPLSLH